MSIKKGDNNIENLMSLYDDYANESKEKKKIMMNTIEEDMKSIINNYIYSNQRYIPKKLIANIQLYTFEYDMVNTKYSTKGLYEYAEYDAYFLLKKIKDYIHNLRQKLSSESNINVKQFIKVGHIEGLLETYLREWEKNYEKPMKIPMFLSKEKIGASSSGYYGEKGEIPNDKSYIPSRNNRTTAGKKRKRKRKRRTMKKRK